MLDLNGVIIGKKRVTLRILSELQTKIGDFVALQKGIDSFNVSTISTLLFLLLSAEEKEKLEIKKEDDLLDLLDISQISSISNFIQACFSVDEFEKKPLEAKAQKKVTS